MAEGWNGAVAQLGERLVCNQEATGSIPVSSTRKPPLEMNAGTHFQIGTVLNSVGHHFFEPRPV